MILVFSMIPPLLAGLLWASPAEQPPNANGLLAWSIEQSAGEDSAKFVSALTANEPWMREFLDSGPVRDAPRSLAFLQSIWTDDPDLGKRPIDRSMATACALEIGQRGRDEANMRLIFDFYRDALNDQKLNLCYDDLATWERRFLAHGVQHGGYNEIASQKYLLDTICWPRAAYVKACWRAPYRLNNCFGDSIHGSMYYRPFAGAFDNSAEQTLTVGAVCGGLSNVGAAAAIANGIPAFTMGEPGHCAYAVQTAPETWSPAYSLSWKRGLHTSINRNSWASHMLTQASFSDPDNVAKANEKRRLAQWHARNGSADLAERTYHDALRVNPLDESLWREFFTFAGTQEHDAKWWEQEARRVQQALLPEHPEPAWSILMAQVFPNLFADASPSQRASHFARFVSRLEGWGTTRWNLEAAFNKMLKSIEDKDRQATFEVDVVERLIDEPKLGPAAVSWATAKAGEDEAKNARLERALLRRTKGKSEGRDAILRSLARAALPAAAEAHDLETFQRVGRAASRLTPARPSLRASNIEPFPGALLSRGGALRIFKPGNRWDGPERHWGVLEERGGDFHTENGTLPWFEVELPNFGELSGIILEGRHGQQQRYEGARILVSSDGSEWQQVATLEGRKNWYRIDLGESNPRARFVRVERDGQCMHFHRVLIYGRKAS